MLTNDLIFTKALIPDFLDTVRPPLKLHLVG